MRCFLVTFVLLTACASTTPSLTTAPPFDKTAFLAPEGQAAVVFIQNDKQDRKAVFTVFESDMRCVAKLRGREVQVLPVEPAPYIFYILGYDNTRRIEIYPEAGRTYFVRLHSVQKAVVAAIEITLVRRATQAHRQVRSWLEGARVSNAKDNAECYGMPLDERKNRTQRRLNEANGDWKNADDVTRDRYMLIESDGLTQADIELF